MFSKLANLSCYIRSPEIVCVKMLHIYYYMVLYRIADTIVAKGCIAAIVWEFDNTEYLQESPGLCITL